MKAIIAFFLFASFVWAAPTIALYQPAGPAGPFPTNFLTTEDARQSTGIRVNLPASFSACDQTSLSVCGSTDLLNQLDGFSVNSRVMVCFSGPVDLKTIYNSGIYTGIYLAPVEKPANTISINQASYDGTTNCLLAKPDRLLEPHTTYVLFATNKINDSKGAAVASSAEFGACLTAPDSYCRSVSAAVRAVKATKVVGDNAIVLASVFTTMSTTGWMQQARSYVVAHQLPILLPAGAVSLFDLDDVAKITYLPQDDSGTNQPVDIPLSALTGVGRVFFGLYFTQNFLSVDGPNPGSISTTPTGLPPGPPITIPGLLPGGYEPVSFHVFLPKTSPPPGGYPVILFGHGLGDNQFGGATTIAATNAKNGFATAVIEITGHGFGQQSSVQVQTDTGDVFTVATPGRGILIPGNSTIGPSDGCVLPGALAVRDCIRQTALDLSAFVRTLQMTAGVGILNPARIYYAGQSFGTSYGTVFLAVEPAIRAALLNAAGPSVEVARTAISGRPLDLAFLAGINPQLLNVAAGVAPPQFPYNDLFNDAFVYRDNPVATGLPIGAEAIQAAFESAEWLSMLGDPLSFAPHLSAEPLSGVSPKNVLFQSGVGDLEVPVPAQLDVIRAAEGQNRSWLLRFDEAAAIDPTLVGISYPGVGFPILPHRILTNPTIFSYPSELSISLAEQQQAALFFLSDGGANPNPNVLLNGIFTGVPLFENVLPPAQPNFFQFGH